MMGPIRLWHLAVRVLGAGMAWVGYVRSAALKHGDRNRQHLTNALQRQQPGLTVFDRTEQTGGLISNGTATRLHGVLRKAVKVYLSQIVHLSTFLQQLHRRKPCASRLNGNDSTTFDSVQTTNCGIRIG